jgi:hypothetical protein
VSERIKVNRSRPGEVLSEMSRHPGLVFTISDIMRNLDYPEEARNAVAQVLRTLVKEGKIESHVHGAFFYAASPVKKQLPMSSIYEYIGTLDDNSIIMRNENGGLERFTKQ